MGVFLESHIERKIVEFCKISAEQLGHGNTNAPCTVIVHFYFLKSKRCNVLSLMHDVWHMATHPGSDTETHKAASEALLMIMCSKLPSGRWDLLHRFEAGCLNIQSTSLCPISKPWSPLTLKWQITGLIAVAVWPQQGVQFLLFPSLKASCLQGAHCSWLVYCESETIFECNGKKWGLHISVSINTAWTRSI